MASPSATRTVVKAGADVLHVRIGIQPSRPWAGVSPLANAEGTRAILARLEQSMADEAGTPTGYIIPVPSSRVDDADLAADIRALRGRAVLGETTAGGWGEGRGAAPTRDWQGQRLGPRFTADEVAARADVERSVLAAAGVPVDLVVPASGGDARESWRRFLHGTLGPIAELIAEELTRVGLSGSVDLSGARRVGPGRPRPCLRAAAKSGDAGRGRSAHLRLLRMRPAPPRYPWLLACLGVDPQTTSMLDRDYRPPPLPAGWHPVTWAELAGEPALPATR